MKARLLLASALVAAGTVCATPAAFAQQAGLARPYSWTGFYIGGQIGYGWQGETDNRIFSSVAAPDASSSFGAVYGARGLVGGIHAGWNYQINAAVLGIEADLEAAGISRSQNPLTQYSVGTVVDPSATIDGASRVRATWLGSVRGRVGVAIMPNVLLYATGGVAFGGLQSSIDWTGVGVFTQNRTGIGWTLGLGAEWAFAANWTARIEYRHIDLGSREVTIPAGVISNNPAVYRAALGRFETVRVGVSYRF
jgi:outer membrane immunogenic protein